MFWTKIKMDGEEFAMCIPPIKYARELQFFVCKEDRFSEDIMTACSQECLVSKKEDLSLISGELDLCRKMPMGLAQVAKMNGDGELSQEMSSYVQLQPMLMPLRLGCDPYFLSPVDYPDGTITTGGSLWYKGETFTIGTAPMIEAPQRELSLGDSDGKRLLSFITYHGCLFCLQPIVRATVKNIFDTWTWRMDWALSHKLEERGDV